MRAAKFLLAGALVAATGGPLTATTPAIAQTKMPDINWSFDGPFGTFNRASAQRGFQVYQEVCSACHSMKEMYYRNLNGIGLNPNQIKAIAASVQVPGPLNDSGEPTMRPGLPSDHFKSPFPNDVAARAANNGALPPDQSLLEKAREGGADYLYGILTDYADPPADMKMGTGMYYNKMYPGHQIAMPPPLTADRVTYADGTKATVDQEARDVVTFLTYAANPEMEQRKQIGVKMVLFLLLLTGLVYALKRKIWARVH